MEQQKYISKRDKFCYSCEYVAVSLEKGCCSNCGANVLNPPYGGKNCFPNCEVCRRFKEAEKSLGLVFV